MVAAELYVVSIVGIVTLLMLSSIAESFIAIRFSSYEEKTSPKKISVINFKDFIA